MKALVDRVKIPPGGREDKQTTNTNIENNNFEDSDWTQEDGIVLLVCLRSYLIFLDGTPKGKRFFLNLPTVGSVCICIFLISDYYTYFVANHFLAGKESRRLVRDHHFPLHLFCYTNFIFQGTRCPLPSLMRHHTPPLLFLRARGKIHFLPIHHSKII